MKIMIIGRPGSGKSTFALQLAQKLNLPLHHLDKYFFTANWIPRNYQEFLTIQQKLVDQDHWIIDGCSLRSLEMRYQRADVCIYFNYPRWLCLYRLIKRMFHKDPAILDRAPECTESISWKLIKYTWTFNYRKDHRLIKQLTMLKKNYPEVLFHTVYNDRDLEQLMKMLTQR